MSEKPPMLSLLEIIKKTTDFFAAKSIEGPRLNAEHLIGHALGLKRMQLYVQFERLLTEVELEKIRPLVRRRALREPLQYIVGEVEWCDLKLKVDKRALIPRPETERLVELTAALFAEPPAKILDAGTGTGAIALALAKQFPAAAVVGLDKSVDALALARENAGLNGLAERVTFLESDWFSAVPAVAEYDLIVSNPPYLTDQEVAEAQDEVRKFEPLSALVAPLEGRADLELILREAGPRLNQGGWLALETGIAQHEKLLLLATQLGWKNGRSAKDLAGRDRFIFAQR